MDASCGRAQPVPDRPLPRVAPERARSRLPGLRRALAVVGRRPRGVLGVGVGLLRGPRAHALRARARLERDARRGVVPRRAAELRRAHARPRRGRRPGRGRRLLAVASEAASSRSATCASRWPARAPACSASASVPATASSPISRTSPRRSSRSSRRRASARSGRRARRSSGRGASSTGSGSSSRRCCSPSPATATATSSIDRRAAGGGDPCRAAEPRGGRPRSLSGRRRTTRCRTRVAWDELLAEPGAARVRPAAVRAPAVRALLLGHDRSPEGDRPLPRRHPPRAPEEPRLQLGPPAGRPAAVVHDDRLDDVERARLGAAPPRVDRDDRRQPGVPRPLVPVARARGDEADVLRPQPRVHDGVPQGGPRARAATSTSPRSAWSARQARRCRSRGTSGSTSSSARRSTSTSGAAARTSAPGSCRGYPLLPVWAGEMSARMPRRRRGGVRPGRASRSSASSASS